MSIVFSIVFSMKVYKDLFYFSDDPICQDDCESEISFVTAVGDPSDISELATCICTKCSAGARDVSFCQYFSTIKQGCNGAVQVLKHII